MPCEVAGQKHSHQQQQTLAAENRSMRQQLYQQQQQQVVVWASRHAPFVLCAPSFKQPHFQQLAVCPLAFAPAAASADRLPHFMENHTPPPILPSQTCAAGHPSLLRALLAAFGGPYYRLAALKVCDSVCLVNTQAAALHVCVCADGCRYGSVLCCAECSGVCICICSWVDCQSL